MRKHTCQLSIAQCRKNCNDTGDDPEQQQPSRTVYGARHICTDYKYTGSDHRARYYEYGIDEFELLFFLHQLNIGKDMKA